MVTEAGELNKPAQTSSVYPNPFSNNTEIVFNETGKHYLETDDITGRKLQWIECNEKEYTFNRNNLANGIYFVRIFDGNYKYISTNKIIVQ